jgi:hypothetical protein
MTREIASSWAQVFDSDLFAPMERAERAEIVKLLKDIEDSAPDGLKDRCRLQAQVTLKEAQVVTANILQNIKTAMTNEQKEISRCLTPHVKRELLDGYHSAMAERGTGSVARQKVGFSYVLFFQVTDDTNLRRYSIITSSITAQPFLKTVQPACLIN